MDVREVLNGLMYVLSTGCQWRAMPKDLPPRSTVNHYFCRWQDDGTLDRLHHALYVLCREQAGREASPTAAIIGRQSVKGAEKGGAGSTRRAEWPKVPPARKAGGMAAEGLMATLFGLYPFLLKLYADAGYQGPKFQRGLALVCRRVNLAIVRRCDTEKFVVLPKRGIVERTIAWLNRCRRLSKDWECLSRNALAFLRSASVRLMLRRLCQSKI